MSFWRSRVAVCIVSGLTALAISSCSAISDDVVDQPRATSNQAAPAHVTADPEGGGLVDGALDAETGGLGSIFGDFASSLAKQAGSGLGQQLLGLMGLGQNTTSLGDLLAELKVIDADLKNIESDLQQIDKDLLQETCDDDLNSLVAPAAIVSDLYYPQLQTFIDQVPAYNGTIPLDPGLVDWANCAIGSPDCQNESQYTSSMAQALGEISQVALNAGEGGALPACVASIKAKGDPVVAHNYQRYETLLAYVWGLQVQGMTVLANAAQFNAGIALKNAGVTVTPKQLGLTKTGKPTPSTQTVCQFIQNPELPAAVSEAAGACKVAYAQLSTTYENMRTELETIGIPLTALSVDADGLIPAFIEFDGTNGTPGSLAFLASLDNSWSRFAPFTSASACPSAGPLPIYPACGPFNAANETLNIPSVPANTTSPGDPLSVLPGGQGWRGATPSELSELSAGFVQDENAPQNAATAFFGKNVNGYAPPTPSNPTNLGSLDVGGSRKIIASQWDNGAPTKFKSCYNNDPGTGYGDIIPFIDTGIGAFTTEKQNATSLKSTHGAPINPSQYPNQYPATDATYNALFSPTSAPAGSKVPAWWLPGGGGDGVVGILPPDSDGCIQSPAWGQNLPWQGTAKWSAANSPYQWPVVDTTKIPSNVIQMNSLTGVPTLTNQWFDYYANLRLPPVNLAIGNQPGPFAPVLKEVSPTSGPTAGGTALTLGGSNLGIDPRATVTVGGVPCQSFAPLSEDGSSATCLTGPGTASGTAGDVVIKTAFGSSTLPAAFTYTQ